MTGLEVTWDKQTSSKDIWSESFHVHRRSKIQTPAIDIHARGQTLPWTNSCQTIFKTNSILWSPFVWKAVGCTRWMGSAWRWSFSWTPSRLGSDKRFKGETNVDPSPTGGVTVTLECFQDGSVCSKGFPCVEASADFYQDRALHQN
jgi:hypothetical protein